MNKLVHRLMRKASNLQGFFSRNSVSLLLTIVFTGAMLLSVSHPTAAKIVFYSYRNGKSEIYAMNDDGSRLRRLTHTPGSDGGPMWSPDGKHIAFSTNISVTDQQQYALFLMKANGSNLRILADFTGDSEPTWSPDGKRIAFSSSRSGELEIHVLDLESGVISQLTNNAEKFEGASAAPNWSPDGKYIAYEQLAGGFWRNIHIMDADGTHHKPLLPAAPGYVLRAFPRWSPDSNRIVYTESVYEIQEVNANQRKPIIVDHRLMIYDRTLERPRQTKLPKGWWVQSAYWMGDKELLLAADPVGMKTKTHGNYDIYRYHLGSGKLTPLTTHPSWDYEPHWVSGPLSVSGKKKKVTRWGLLKILNED